MSVNDTCELLSVVTPFIKIWTNFHEVVPIEHVTEYCDTLPCVMVQYMVFSTSVIIIILKEYCSTIPLYGLTNAS